MKEKIKKNNQQQETLRNKAERKGHFTLKNIIIDGLIALIPASLIIGRLRDLRMGGALITTPVFFGLLYLVGKIREKKGAIIAIIILVIITLIVMNIL